LAQLGAAAQDATEGGRKSGADSRGRRVAHRTPGPRLEGWSCFERWELPGYNLVTP